MVETNNELIIVNIRIFLASFVFSAGTIACSYLKQINPETIPIIEVNNVNIPKCSAVNKRVRIGEDSTKQT